MVSTNFRSPILVPLRRCAVCCACDMDSWPPATITLASPLAICCMPSATARRPEPQSWLRPKAVASCGHAGLHGGLAGRVLALAGGEDLAEDDLVDVLGGNAGALESGLDRDGAEFVGGQRRRARR